MDNTEFKLVETLSNFPETEKAQFNSSLNSESNVRTNYHRVEYDLSWLDMMEDTVRYIDNILINPKRFIINEEELVKVEKSKKVTVESVMHLCQHTNLISDFNEDTGEVKPTKILNILKEETLDTYENRFIFTLINNMMSFITVYGEQAMQGSSINSEKNVHYTATTKINGESIKFEMNMLATHHANLDKRVNGLSVAERINRVRERVVDFTGSDLYKDLSKLHAAPVRSPIRKTNVILKNPNFQRAEALWNFLEKYDKDSKKETKYNRNLSDNLELKRDLDNTFMIDYALIDSLSKNKEVDASWQDINLSMLKRAIKSFIDYDPYMDENGFMSVVKKEFKEVRREQQSRINAITGVIEHDLNMFDKNKAQALNALR